MLAAGSAALPAPLFTFIRSGYLAVGTFFVLSGFVLARRYQSTVWTQRSLYRYVVSRVARIYPVYALSLLAVAPFMIFEFRPAWIANYIVLLQGWFPNAPGWNTPAWSLSCEIFFYCLFPVAVIALRWRGGAFLLAAVALVLTSRLRMLGTPESLKPLLHLSDFLMGIAAGGMYGFIERSRRLRSAGPWLYLPASLAAATLVCFPHFVFSWSTMNGMLRPLNAIILLGFALGGGVIARWLSRDVPVFLGKASYSLYILHVPLLWWWKFAQPVNPLPSAISGLVYIAFVVAITAWIYQRFEDPANQRVRNYLNG